MKTSCFNQLIINALYVKKSSNYLQSLLERKKMDREGLKIKIEQELKKVKMDVQELEEQAKPISPENSLGRISRMDAINNKSVVEASLRQALDKRRKLEEALTKINENDFGICVKCKQPIPEGRIMLMPHAKKCVNCA